MRGKVDTQGEIMVRYDETRYKGLRKNCHLLHTMAAMIKLLLMVFFVKYALDAACVKYDRNKTGTNLVRIRGKRGLLKEGAERILKAKQWVLRLMHVSRARAILLKDAIRLKTDYEFEVDWYVKSGDYDKARRDFWALSTCCGQLKLRQDLNGHAEISRYGRVGENTAELIRSFSDEVPYPAIFMYKRMSDESVDFNLIVLYRNTIH